MSRGKTDSDIVECPYFNACEKQAVYCEGVEEGSRLRLTFSHPSRLKSYQKEYCNSMQWKKCRIAGMLELKWKELLEDDRK